MAVSTATRIAEIAFDRQKYNRSLSVDACQINSIPGFIKAPMPHRLGFYEIAFITTGRGFLEIDGSGLAVAPYRVCITAPGELRSWRLEQSRLDGYLVFFEADFLNEFFADRSFLDNLPICARGVGKASYSLQKPQFHQLIDIVEAMHDELRDVQPDSCHLLRAQTYRLLITLQRHCGARPEPTDGTRIILRKFLAAVDRDHLQSDCVSHYAQVLGITTRHLNQCVKLASGITASDTIQRKLLLEARRLLVNTDMRIFEIAHALNFEDPSYFNRFFKRHAGVTPRVFRAQHRSAIFVPMRPL